VHGTKQEGRKATPPAAGLGREEAASLALSPPAELPGGKTLEMDTAAANRKTQVRRRAVGASGGRNRLEKDVSEQATNQFNIKQRAKPHTA